MRRRDLISLVAGAAAWPVVVRAQAAMPVIGFLHFGTSEGAALGLKAFRQGLSEAGYLEDRNITIEPRFAQGDLKRLPELAADLVRRRVAVIVAAGSPGTVAAAKAATSSIPIAFVMGDDPVRHGLVASINRPGGNATGIYVLSGELGGKRLNLLIEAVPRATTVAYLSGPSSAPIFESWTSHMRAAARALAREILVAEARGLSDLEATFATIVERRADALVVGDYTSFYEPSDRDKILALAARHRIPAIYGSRLFVLRGGLMSYSGAEGAYRQAGAYYVGRILKGAKPADLPVQQPTKFSFAINLKTAKALGLEIPPMLLARADEVIE
jgi:putative ABC transport system substrate-binding protein